MRVRLALVFSLFSWRTWRFKKTTWQSTYVGTQIVLESACKLALMVGFALAPRVGVEPLFDNWIHWSSERRFVTRLAPPCAPETKRHSPGR